jgi:predicted helicase
MIEIVTGAADERSMAIDNRSHLSINGIPIVAPLYIYQEDGTYVPNFAPTELSALTRQLTGQPSPEDILDYIYAVLHSPSYREKYK